MTDPSSRRVSFRLEGSSHDGGLVRASDFLDWFDRVLQCLRRLERGRPGRLETIYRIAELRAGSAVVELEAVSEADQDITASAVVADFLRGAEALEKGQLRKLPFDVETKAAFAALASPLRRQLRQVTITSGSSSVSLKPEQVSAVSIDDRVSSISVSSYSGFVDAINVHKDPIFYLYPTTGPSRVPCVFDHALLDDLRNAIKRYTTVFGTFEFVAGSPFPERIVVDRIEVNPPEDELPTLRSLFGVAPQLTRGIDSVTYVRRQRDAER